MKNLLLILSVLFFITSCNEGEIKQEEPLQKENSIYNKWDLVKYEPGFSPIQNFNSGLISWSFQQNNILQVETDDSIDSAPLKRKGEYNFLTNEGRISIDNVTYDFSIHENTLVISDDPSSDGFKITFSKKTE